MLLTESTTAVANAVPRGRPFVPQQPDEVGDRVKLDVGPVERVSAVAWIDWAHGVFGDLRSEPATKVSPSTDVLDEVSTYLQQWLPGSRTIGGRPPGRPRSTPTSSSTWRTPSSTLDTQQLAGVPCVACPRVLPESRAF